MVFSFQNKLISVKKLLDNPFSAYINESIGDQPDTDFDSITVL